jgi:hypothetical protein
MRSAAIVNRPVTSPRQIVSQARHGEWEGAALKNLAAIASTAGDHAHAADLYDQAIAVFHRAGDRYQETTALIDSGHAFMRSSQPAKAYQPWQLARSITEQTGDPRIAIIDTLLGDPALATTS